MVVGSSSPVGHNFNDCIGDAMDAEELRSALKDVASSSRKATRRSGGWTSSEDEADPMDHEEEGCPFSIVYCKMFYFPLSWLVDCFIFHEIKVTK